MLIAFTAMENSLEALIDPRFGRAAYYIIVNTETDEITIHDNSDGINAANGAGTGAAQTLSEYGVEELYTGRVGPKAADVLDKAGIRYYENLTGTVQEVLNKIKSGSLMLPQPPAQQQAALASATPGAETSTTTCPGAIPNTPGYRIAGQRRGLGRGMGAGCGVGRGQGAGRGRGACRR